MVHQFVGRTAILTVSIRRPFFINEPSRGKTNDVVSEQADTNRVVQAQKMARDWEKINLENRRIVLSV